MQGHVGLSDAIICHYSATYPVTLRRKPEQQAH